MAKEYGSFFGSRLGERVRSPLGEFGSPAAYLIAGHIHWFDESRTLTDRMDRYAEDHWDARQVTPVTVWGHVAWGNLGRVHIAAGFEGLNRQVLDHRRYDGETDAWESMQDIPEPRRSDAVAVQIGSRAHVCNGLEEQDDPDEWRGRLVAHHSYIESDDSWVALQDVPGHHRTRVCGFVLDQRAFVVGGGIQNTGNPQQFRSGENAEYDPTTDTWMAKALFPNLFTEEQKDYPMDQAAATLWAGSRGYTFLGNANWAFRHNWVHHYIRSDDTWTRDADVPSIGGFVVPRELSAAVLGGVAHLMGGALAQPPPGYSELEHLRFDHYGEVWDRRGLPPEPARDETIAVAP